SAAAPTFSLFADTSTTNIYTLSLHDALPISPQHRRRSCSLSGTDTHHQVHQGRRLFRKPRIFGCCGIRTQKQRQTAPYGTFEQRSEEHTSELQSRFDLVCRLLLEKKNRSRDT